MADPPTPEEPTRAVPVAGGGAGPAGADPTKRGGLVFGAGVVLVVGLLSGLGLAAATRDNGANEVVAATSTTVAPITTTTTGPPDTTTTTTTAPPDTTTTTTTTTTTPPPTIVSFTGPANASCPVATVSLSWTTQNASGTELSVAGGAPSAQPASGSTNAPFDCTAASVTYTLNTTGGTPAASQSLTVTNNSPPP